nr:radical SAM protein [Gloeothece verrucosa]
MIGDSSTASPSFDSPRLWYPKRVLFTPSALNTPTGQQIHQRMVALNLPIEELSSNRINIFKGLDEREIYRQAKTTLAVVTAPSSSLKLNPVPPSADWQFHIAQGCPAHCQYCYLAGSLTGAPLIRVYANLPEILNNLSSYCQPNSDTSFEVSCYTDPLALEHLTGSLSECIRYFGTMPAANLRVVTKFDEISPLISLPHNGQTRIRVSINAAPVSRSFEAGTASVEARLKALRKLALPQSEGGGGYRVGVVIAPIMLIDNWQLHYRRLFEQIEKALDFECDLTFELITHRFTAKSKEVILQWYPKTKLDLDEKGRSVKYNKFGGTKYVYLAEQMKMMKQFFTEEIAQRFPSSQLLYWT